MTPEQFAYWLQGYAEVHGEAPSAEQWAMIKDHLQLVFQKVTPGRRQVAPADPFRHGTVNPPLWPYTPTTGDPLEWLRWAPQCVSGGKADTSVRVIC